MKETQEVEVKQSEQNETSTSINASVNTTERPLQTQQQPELLEVKPKIKLSKFESLLINSFKKLVGFNEPKQEKKQNAEDELHRINLCEEELRKALEEIKGVENIFVNKNIIDKCSRINKKNKINLSLIVGHIFIEFMNKKNIFTKINQKSSIDKNIIIAFINEVINMNTLLKKTYLGIKYENSLFNFLENIIHEVAFDSEQLNEINTVLKEHKDKLSANKLNVTNSKEFLNSINIIFHHYYLLQNYNPIHLHNIL